jgi:charged multivesicular body protein 6
MGSVFGKGGNSNNKKNEINHNADVTDKDRAILELKNARDRLKKYRKKLGKDSEKLQAQAIELIKLKQRDRALLVLKLKRFKEKETNNADGQLISVLEMIDTVEWEHSNMEVLKALKSGTNMLNKMHEEMSLDDIENLLDETNEAIEVENQINSLIAGQLNVADDEELELELAGLMKDELQTGNLKKTVNTATAVDEIKFPVVPTVPVMPTVPYHQVETKKEKDTNDAKKTAVNT